MVEVKWTDFAIQNLNEIGDYIEKKSYTSYASRVVSYDYKRAYPDESLPDCLQSG